MSDPEQGSQGFLKIVVSPVRFRASPSPLALGLRLGGKALVDRSHGA
jgi:hypothetical protein